MYNIDSEKTLVVFGEWAGGNIQKNVGVANIQKSFFIFDIKTVDENDVSTWYDISEQDFLPKHDRIFKITDYETYEIEIDLNEPKFSQNKLGELTIEVEKECPVAKAFGFSGIGEGIVWRHIMADGHDIRFKVKGELHSVSKVKTLASVDEEKLNSIKEFTDYAVTENRVRQGIQIVWGEGEINMKQMGEFMKWFVGDVLAEETNAMIENGLDPKEIGRDISNAARKLFLEIRNSF